MENPAIVADSMTRILFRRVFWSLLVPCFFLSYRAWKQSASFYHSQGNPRDHLPPAFQALSYHMRDPGETSSVVVASKKTKPKAKWLFVHMASGERLPNLEGSSFWEINPTPECPRIFSQTHKLHGSSQALQLPCFQDMIVNEASADGLTPLTFLDMPPSTVSDTLFFWKKLIDTLSKDWDVVLAVLYEPFYTFAVREWPAPLDESPKIEISSLEQALQRLARRHTTAHLTPLFDNVKITTSWQEVECLFQCPVTTDEVKPFSVPQKCAPCLPHKLSSYMLTLSWEQEQTLLGPQKQANSTRLGQEYNVCLRMSGCPVQVDGSSERWQGGASVNR